MKKLLRSIGYKLEYNAVEPVFRNKRVYAVASPYSGGAWLSFPNKKSIEKWMKDHRAYENERITPVVME